MCTEGSPAEMELRLESSTSCPPHPPSPRSLKQRAVTASGGTWDQVHRPEAGAAAVGEGPSSGRPDLVLLRPYAGPGTSAAQDCYPAAFCLFR